MADDFQEPCNNTKRRLFLHNILHNNYSNITLNGSVGDRFSKTVLAVSLDGHFHVLSCTYNDRERCHLHSDHEGKCYNQVC